jgi:RNA polymerase sigma factor (sigma-70 family)
MPLDQMTRVVHRVRQTALVHGGMTDGQLLERFIADRDETAFAALVQRHGAMVHGVCRRVVGHVQDAEDAFQATFVVLIRKAASVTPREAVGNWLYGVAYRTALEAKARRARRRMREMQVQDMPQPMVEPAELWHDLQPILDRELSRLPDKYRLPVVLCDLEGRARQEVSQQLALPEGTLSSRLARGRKLLAARLARHGFALAAGTLVLLLAEQSASAAPATLVVSTVQAATGSPIAPVAALVEGVLKAMFLTKIKTGVTALVVVALLGTGTSFVTHQVLGGPDRTADPVVGASRASNEVAAGGRDEAPRTRPDLTGKIIAVGDEGKTLTLEIAGAGREEPAKTAEVRLAANTVRLFSGVGVGGAQLRPEGFTAQVWLADGSKDTAARVHFIGRAGERPGPDVTGQVASVAAGGKAIAFRLAQRGRADLGQIVDVHLPEKTQVLYSNIARGGAKPTEGYHAEVWFKAGSKDTAARVNFNGSAEKFERGVPEQKPDATGKVIDLMKEVLTLELPSRERGQEPVKLRITLSDQTSMTYFQVGPDGDRPMPGYQARVWFFDGAKDTACKIIFHGVPKEPPSVQGKVIGIGKDGKTLTLEVPGKERGDPPGSADVKLTLKTRLVFHGVAPDGALLTEGYFAQVTLAEGSTDIAAQVVLGPMPAGGR